MKITIAESTRESIVFLTYWLVDTSAHGYTCGPAPTLLEETLRAGTSVTAQSNGRSGRERRHNPLQGHHITERRPIYQPLLKLPQTSATNFSSSFAMCPSAMSRSWTISARGIRFWKSWKCLCRDTIQCFSIRELGKKSSLLYSYPLMVIQLVHICLQI